MLLMSQRRPAGLQSEPAFLNPLFQLHSFTAISTFSCPDYFPWPLKNLRRPGKLVFRIVMLVNAAFHITSMAAVKPSRIQTLQYVNPEWQFKLRIPKRLNL